MQRAYYNAESGYVWPEDAVSLADLGVFVTPDASRQDYRVPSRFGRGDALAEANETDPLQGTPTPPIERVPLPPLDFDSRSSRIITEADRTTIRNTVLKELGDLLNGPASYYPDGGPKDWEAVSRSIGNLIESARRIPGVVYDPSEIMQDIANELTQFKRAFDAEGLKLPSEDPPDRMERLPNDALNTRDNNVIYPDLFESRPAPAWRV